MRSAAHRDGTALQVWHRACEYGAMIGVIGDYNAQNPTHIATTRALEVLPRETSFEWMATDELSSRARWLDGLDGFLVAPASPYRDTSAVLEVIRSARERGVPLLGT